MRPISTFAIYFLIVAVFALLAVLRPAMALAAILCTYALEQWAQSQQPFFITHGSLTNYVTGGILLIALISKQLQGEPVLSGYPRIGKVVLALFGFALLSTLWSVYRQGTIEQWTQLWPYLVTFIVLAPLLVTRPEDLRVGFMATLALGAVVLLLLMVDTPWEGRTIVLSAGVMRGGIFTLYGNPLAVASLAGHVALIALLLNFRGTSRFWQIARWGIIMLGLAVSIRSGSRGQLFALLIAAIAFLPVSRRINNFRGFIATAIGAGMMLYAASFAFEQFAERGRWERDTMVEAFEQGRLGQAMILVERWASSPGHWLIGLGNSAAYDPKILGGYPHLVMLEVLAEEGLIGFVLLWLVVILVVRCLVRLYRQLYDDPVYRGVLAAVGALFLFEVILSFKQGSLLGTELACAFAIMIGRFELGLLRQQQQERYQLEQAGVTDEAGYETMQPQYGGT